MKKKQSGVIRRDYSKDDCRDLSYYGILMKNGRVRLDTKRYKRFFSLPDPKIEHRKDVYYHPSKVHAHDYNCNVFRMEVAKIKGLWVNEYSKAIELIKTPKQVEDDARVGALSDGVLEYEEADMAGRMAGLARDPQYRLVIKSLYAQFFHQFMSDIAALTLRVCAKEGFSGDYFERREFDSFFQGKQKATPAKQLKDLKSFPIYDEAYALWNFLKHNSRSAYEKLKGPYPERVYDPEDKYRNGQSALSVAKIDERYILFVLDHICDFFDEVCELAFGENPKDAKWDYDDYFVEEATGEIEAIDNPLGLPWWL